jgi:hypothetical protein
LFKQIQAELEGLGLTEAETELVLSNDEVAAAVASTVEPPTADEPEEVAKTADGADTVNEPEKVEETAAENEAPSAVEETVEAPTEETQIEENEEANKDENTDAEGTSSTTH